MQRTEGTKYSGFRSATDIAKDIRKDIKTAVADGKLPKDIKVSVRSNYYAGGQSIDIRWSASTATHAIGCSYHRRDLDFDSCSDHPEYRVITLSTRGNRVEEVLREIANSYNYDNSDVQTDYFDTLFYCHPQWDYATKLKGSNIHGLPLAVAETLVTLHRDGTPVAQAMEIAEKLESVSN